MDPTNGPPTGPPPPLGPAHGEGVVPQLPPQMFTTAAQLLDLTDKKLVVVLRDGRKLFGILRSWDQFANLVLQSTTERLFLPQVTGETHGIYTDIARGTFLVRGENVLLLGELDIDALDESADGLISAAPEPRGWRRASYEEVEEGRKTLEAEEKRRNGKREGLLKREGFEGELAAEG